MVPRTSILGLSPSRRSGFSVSSLPLPATLAGGLTSYSPRGFRTRIAIQSIPCGFVAAFRHRRSPPGFLLLGPRRLPFGRPLGFLRVLPPFPTQPLAKPPRPIEVSLAFSLDPAPYGLRFGVQAFPAVTVYVLANPNGPALLTRHPSPCVSIR